MRPLNARERADRLENRWLDRIEFADRQAVAVYLPRSAWRQIERSLADRAEAITARLPAEPVLRRCALTESERCRDNAGALAAQLREARS